MAYVTPPITTKEEFAPNGTGIYGFAIEYIEQEDIQVSLYDDGIADWVLTAQNDATNPWIFLSLTQIQFTNGDPGVNIQIKRNTDINETEATFAFGSAIRAQDLNNNFEQSLFALQENNQDIVRIDGDIDTIEDEIVELNEIIVNTLQFVPVADVAALNEAAALGPENLKGYEILNSTDIDTLANPVIELLPPGAGSNPGEDPVTGVYWNSGIVTRVQWIEANQNWRFILYYSKDGDNRYQQLTLSDPITPDPADYKDGTLWFDSSDANLYVLYNDGNSRQWVITNPLSAYGQIVTTDDVYWTRNASTNTVYPKQSTDNIANNNGSAVISSDGAATFAGGALVAGGSEIRVGSGTATFAVNDGLGTGFYAGSGMFLQDTNGANTVGLDAAAGSATFTGPISQNFAAAGSSGIQAYGVYTGAGAVSPTASIKTDGSAEFVARVSVGTAAAQGSPVAYGIAASANADNSSNTAAVFGRNYSSTGRVWSGLNGAGTTTSAIFATGTFSAFPAVSTYGFCLGLNESPAGGLFRAASGAGSLYLAASYGGTATVNLFGQDGSAVFAGTVTANGSILTRISGDLDVGERLEKADNALKALKVAALAATDFNSLKTAILTSLQEV